MRILVVFALALAACDHTVTSSAPDLAEVVDAGSTHVDLGSDAATAPLDGSIVTPDAGSGCGPCNTPPDSCHAKTGTCVNGVCSYDFVEGATCDDGNDCTVGDTCDNGACVGTPMVCNSAPAAVCLSSTSEKTYDPQGTCSGGLCVYQSHTVPCSGACTNGTCTTNACAGITCNMPPSVCYASSGTCASGACSYAYADGATCDDANKCTTNDSCGTGVCQGIPTSCATPPANTCANSTTLKSYASSGSCAAADGTCSYSYAYVPCPTGCASGACKPSGWTAMTSNTNSDLYGVWGASATQVWAVGQGGVVTYYDGTKWEVVSGPMNNNEDIKIIHGSSATDVYAMSRYSLFRFDGTSWTLLQTFGDNDNIYTGVWATGNATRDVYLSTIIYDAASAHTQLSKYDSSGTLTIVGTASNAFGGESECDAPNRGIWVNAASDVYLNGCIAEVWNGSTLDPAGTNQPLGGKYWSSSASNVFSIAASELSYASSMSHWNGTSWTTSSSGLDGELTDLWGTGAKSVYFVGDDANGGVVLYWDGTGFTRQTLPSGAKALNAVWAAPNGKVFAVGAGGTILTGP